MQEPTAGRALGAGFRAVAGESWVAVLGLGVTAVRGALALPAIAFVWSISAVVAREAISRGGGPEAVLGTVAQAWASSRFLSIAVGLWLAGALLWGAVRVAWVAGAAPSLAWRMSGGQGPPPGFAEGAAWRFHRVLPIAVVAFLLDLAGKAMVVLVSLGVIGLGARIQGRGAPGAAAFVAALALAGSAFLAASLSAIGDVAVARAAMAGESAGKALRRGAHAFLTRPAACVAVVLAVWLAAGLAAGSAQGVIGAFGGIARGGPRMLLVFPEVLLSVLAALVAAGAELWRLAALGVLALSPQPGRETRWMSLRSESLGIRPPSQ